MYIFVNFSWFSFQQHWTKTDISYMFCLPTHDISYTYMAGDRVEFYTNKWNVQIILLALSYKFPTCMKSKISFSASPRMSQETIVEVQVKPGDVKISKLYWFLMMQHALTSHLLFILYQYHIIAISLFSSYLATFLSMKRPTQEFHDHKHFRVVYKSWYYYYYANKWYSIT